MSEGKNAATPQYDLATIDALIAELVEPGFVLHGEDGDITYFNIGEWLRSKLASSVAAPKAQPAGYPISSEELHRRLKATRDEIHGAPKAQPTITLEVYQHDWIPGFASFHSDGERAEGATKHVALNLGSLIAAVQTGDMDKRDLPYMVAESLMHETVHALEEWAGVEFSEDRVEELLAKYREKYSRATIWEYTGNPPSEACAPKAGEPQADWLHETDSVKFGLKYIADSPAHEFGGFHPKTFEIAKEALQRIEELERGAGEPPQELVKLVSAVQEFLKHDGGSGSEDYDALKRSEARRSMQSVLGFRCPKCGETLPHLYDENCTDYRVRGAGETPAERWIPVEEKLPPKNRHTSWKNYRCSDVVVAFNGQQTTAEAITNPDGETVWVDGDVTVKNVTHWRPLPLPPGAGSTKEGK